MSQKLVFKSSTVKKGTFEADCAVELLVVGEKEQQNSNGTTYKVVTAKLNGKNITAIIYQGNYSKGIEVGNNYAAKAIYDPSRGGELLIQMSHLIAGERANIADFEFEMVETDELAAIAKEAKLEKVK
jgi:hypothetical protein